MTRAKQRLRALDVLRGITVLGMILVNNAGGPVAYAPLCHAEWNGLTLADLVFPFFLFIMGVTTYLSLSKSHFHSTPQILFKIVRRTLLILLLGWLIYLLEGYYDGRTPLLAHLRLTGVLPRIAVCYFLTALLALTLRHKHLPLLAALLLVAYSVLLLVGHGYCNDTTNILAIVDNRLLGSAHLYQRAPIDPEGVLSTVSALSHTIIGFCCGKWLAGKGQTLHTNMERLLLVGCVLLVAGLLVNTLLPINKRLWSPSFVLVTCGMAALLLAILVYIVDIRKGTTWGIPFEIYGVNPLFLYMLSEVVALLLGHYGAQEHIYLALCTIVGNPYAASLLYAVLFTLLMGIVGAFLYRRKIYIKV